MEIGKEQENSPHTSSMSYSKQIRKYRPWKTALARHRTRNMIVFITKGHKVPKYIAKHPSCKPQNMKVNIFQHHIVKDFETKKIKSSAKLYFSDITVGNPKYQQ